ncbi:hypothetical protein GCM10020221_00990 [Streptomyces thioluteus]|uniref:Uncharacterized protein n=1 Tax=Streptomyces thioluteus TaxID=66431 RepID=A0ABN3WBR7_STRTU
MSDFLSFRLLLDLVRMPRWLAGPGSDGLRHGAGRVWRWGGGEISLVEPLLATNLLFRDGPVPLADQASRWALTGLGAALWLLAGGRDRLHRSRDARRAGIR